MPAGAKKAQYDLVIIGGGMAAGRLLKQLHQLNYAKKVALLSLESRAGYNRVLLPGFLSGRYQTSELTTNEDWRTNHNFDVLANCSASAINPFNKSVMLGSGKTIGYTELVIATGSSVARPQLPGSDLENVFELRSMADADNIRAVCAAATSAVVIGGGLLGLEAADALKALGLKVCVVHRGKQLMNRQLDVQAGEQLAQALVKNGIAIRLNTQVASLIGCEKLSAVRLQDNTTLPADILLIATGTVPNDELARKARIPCEDGVTVDEQLRTSVPGVYALGECAQVAGNRHSLVEATHAQADSLAKTLNGYLTPVSFAAPATRLKVSNTALFSAGQTRPAQNDDANDIVVRDQSAGIYRRLLFSGSTLLGAVLLGDTNASVEITQRIGSVVASSERDRLVFGAS